VQFITGATRLQPGIKVAGRSLSNRTSYSYAKSPTLVPVMGPPFAKGVGRQYRTLSFSFPFSESLDYDASFSAPLLLPGVVTWVAPVHRHYKS
jgi:hypothetical protein